MRRFCRFFLVRQDEPCKTGKEVGSLTVQRQKGNGQKCVPSLTSPLKNQATENGKICAQKRMQEVAKDREVLTPPRKKVLEGVEERESKRYPKSAADKVPANDEGGRGVNTSQRTTAKTSGIRHHHNLMRGESLPRLGC